MCKVSIVLPCYNHGEYVEDAIKSILNQTYTDYEVFIFDNGSTDNSWEVINKFDGPNITKIRLMKNDLLEVKKQFIEKAKGQYFAILYSDDIWLPQKLEKQMKFFEKNKEARVCFAWSKFVDEKFNPLPEWKGFFEEYNKSQKEWWETFLSRANHLSCPSFICEKDIYIRYFGKLYPFRQIADYYCWMKILQETNLYVIEEVLVNQRMHDSGENRNESYRCADNILRENIEVKFILYNIIDEMDDDIFLKMFCDTDLHKSNYKHIDVLCEKFLFFVKRNSGFLTEYDNAIRYYNVYFDYEEDGEIFYRYLDKKFNYSRNKFFKYETGEKDDRKILESRFLRWIKLENTNFSDIKYPDTISIYGCGDIGKVFYRRVNEYCSVEQFIDQRPRREFYRNIPILTIKEAKLNEESIIIVIPTYDFEEIIDEIKKIHPYVKESNIIRFEDFISTGEVIDSEF